MVLVGELHYFGPCQVDSMEFWFGVEPSAHTHSSLEERLMKFLGVCCTNAKNLVHFSIHVFFNGVDRRISPFLSAGNSCFSL